MGELIAFVDTETTGLHADRHPMWEVAVIIYDPATRTEQAAMTWQLALSGPQLADADPVALELNGFHARYGQTCGLTSPVTAIEEIVAYIGTAHLAGAVVSFDEERLRRLAWEAGVEPRWHYHLIDVEALAIGYLNGVAAGRNAVAHPGSSSGGRVPDVARLLPWKSADLSRAVGVDPDSFDGKHEAEVDARWALAIYEAVTRHG